MPLSALKALRQTLQVMGANAFFVSLSDPHLSEYIPEHYALIKPLTGFTGSNAKLIVTENDALLWTDSRYWAQAQKELSCGITLMKEGETSTPKPHEWLKEKNQTTPVVLATPLAWLPAATFKCFKEGVQKIIDFNDASIEPLWPKRPALTPRPLFIHTASTETARAKLTRLQAFLQKAPRCTDQAALLLTRLDDIAWLTNLRGRDIAFNPVFLAWALVGTEEATVFLNESVLTDAIREHLTQSGWSIKAYDEILDATQAYESLFAKEEDLNARLFSKLEPKLQALNHPISLWKSIKTPEEIAALKRIMKDDSAALEAFICEVKTRLNAQELLTENDAVAILHKYRSQIAGFIDESFGTIAAVNANAALPHYAPDPGKGASITPPCILLVDSGAHYDVGTTDTTRVWFLGNPQDFDKERLTQLKQDYRAVYEAMQALMNARFRPGTTGYELDAIAREPIRAIGTDYGHGTGHGIGLTLNVHETPPSISPRETEGSKTAFMPGMIVSDEPGIYREGLWGIRLENMLVCVEKAPGELGFECLTQCAIDEVLLSD